MTRPPVFRIERLEDRTVPAGNVTADLIVDGSGFRTLRLTGDAADNRVTLTGLPAGGVQVGGVSTTVNGGKSAVSFAHIDGIEAALGGGNDTFRGVSLGGQTVSIDGGAGNDDLKLTGTSLAKGVRDANLMVSGDSQTGAVTNGRDKIDVSGTRISGNGSIRLYGDNFDVTDAPDDIRLTHTALTATGENLFVEVVGGGFTGVSTTPAGDTITIGEFQANVASTKAGNSINFSLTGSSGGDRFELNCVGLTIASAGRSNDVSINVEGGAGSDRLDATDMTVSATGPANVFNYGFLRTVCEDVRIQHCDVTVTGGLDFSDGWGALIPLGLSFTGVQNLKFRDARIAVPEGGGSFDVSDYDPSTGDPLGDTRILLDDVQIDQVGFGFISTFVSVDGSDHIRLDDTAIGDVGVFTYEATLAVDLDDCDLESLQFFGGAGDDTLRIRDSAINSVNAALWTGNDTVEVRGSRFESGLTVEGNDGDDRITLRGSVFHGSVFIEGSGGADLISVSNVTVQSGSTDSPDATLYLNTDAEDLQGGGDVVTISNSAIWRLEVTAGIGNDLVIIRNSVFDAVTADLGDGDDTAVIENNTATTRIAVSGGGGWDTLVAWGNIAPDLFFDDFEA